MKVLIIGNLSDVRCGYANYTHQLITALQRSGQVEVGVFDGTYEQVYARTQQGIDPFFPVDLATYDVVHVIWHAMTLNHYTGADWGRLPALGVLRSWHDGGPSDACCPFQPFMDLWWSEYEKSGFHFLTYPVPDWVTDLPQPDPDRFTVGMSSVRGDGVGLVQRVCEDRGWGLNLPTPGMWRPLEDEVRRLARSTVNVCWYRTPPLWKGHASAPSMLLASGRPLLINNDSLLWHLQDRRDLYHGQWTDPDPTQGVSVALDQVYRDWHHGTLQYPTETAQQISWTHAAQTLIAAWTHARGESHV